MKRQFFLGLLLFITGISFSQELVWKNPIRSLLFATTNQNLNFGNSFLPEASSGIVMNTSLFSSGFYILTVRSSSFKRAVKVFINK